MTQVLRDKYRMNKNTELCVCSFYLWLVVSIFLDYSLRIETLAVKQFHSHRVNHAKFRLFHGI
jgi:hypothetical protein